MVYECYFGFTQDRMRCRVPNQDGIARKLSRSINLSRASQGSHR